jgi:hypothetical protein
MSLTNLYEESLRGLLRECALHDSNYAVGITQFKQRSSNNEVQGSNVLKIASLNFGETPTAFA